MGPSLGPRETEGVPVQKRPPIHAHPLKVLGGLIATSLDFTAHFGPSQYFGPELRSGSVLLDVQSWCYRIWALAKLGRRGCLIVVKCLALLEPEWKTIAAICTRNKDHPKVHGVGFCCHLPINAMSQFSLSSE